MTLNEKQKNRIQASFESGNLDISLEIENLVSQGVSKEEAVEQIQAEVNSYRKKLFDQKVKKDDSEDQERVAMVVVVMMGLVGPVFDITSLVWYVVASAIAGGIGYWAYKEKPLAGLIGCVCVVVLLPITYNWYVSGRRSIIKIELLIPIALALIPSFLMGLLISKLVYSDK